MSGREPLTVPFAIIPEWVLYADVTDRALRLYAVLKRAADRGNDSPRRREISVLMRCGESSVLRATRELEAIGAIEAVAAFRDDGSQAANVYRVWPWLSGQGVPLVTTDEGGVSPSARLPLPVERTPVEKNALALVTPDPFDAFWKTYPRKTGKLSAQRAFAKALKNMGGPGAASVLVDAAARYRDDPNRDAEFTKHAATWLNGGCWDDEPLPVRTANAPRPMSKSQTNITEAMRLIREQENQGAIGRNRGRAATDGRDLASGDHS